jgi:hypothetical protein
MRSYIVGVSYFLECRTGDLITGDLITGDLITGDLITGDLITGDLIFASWVGCFISGPIPVFSRM